MDPDQTSHSVASDQGGLHCLPITLLGVSRLKWVNHELKTLVSVSNRINNSAVPFEMRSLVVSSVHQRFMSYHIYPISKEICRLCFVTCL